MSSFSSSSLSSSSLKRDVFRVGSRKSQLALAQTQKVIKILKEKFPSLSFEIVSMTTTGDNIIDKALANIGDKSLFTKELEVALIANAVDFVVHSLKDVPTELPPGLVVSAICKRDDPRDCLILRKTSLATSLDSLPQGSVVGTSSTRRTAQLRKLFPHLIVHDVRGNLNTRMTKLDGGQIFDGLILATAGLDRLGWNDRVTQVLDSNELMYAVGQGAMCVECRCDDEDTIELLSALVDLETVIQCVTERSFLKRLEGGCSAPVAVRCDLVRNELILQGGVYSVDGSESITDHVSCHFETLKEHKTQPENTKPQQYVGILIPTVPNKLLEVAQNLGFQLADQLKAAGATPILKDAKERVAEIILKGKEAKEKYQATKVVDYQQDT